jgi:hypothetical protein
VQIEMLAVLTGRLKCARDRRRFTSRHVINTPLTHWLEPVNCVASLINDFHTNSEHGRSSFDHGEEMGKAEGTMEEGGGSGGVIRSVFFFQLVFHYANQSPHPRGKRTSSTCDD